MYEDCDKEEGEIDIEECVEDFVQSSGVIMHIKQGKIDGALELIEAEDVTRKAEEEEMNAHCQILDDEDEEEEDSFEAIVGVVIFIRVVFHVSVEVNHEDYHHAHHKNC